MKILKRDGTLIGEWETLAEAIAAGADLRGADLYGANLSGVRLRGADLSGADLYGADLSGVRLRGADLRGADLREADLRGADLREADLRCANLRGARWNNAALAGATGGPWHFGLSRHAAIVHEGKISIGCMTETVKWWQEHYRAVGRKENYTDAETAEYGAWIEFVAQRLRAQEVAAAKGGTE